ncbi:MAG: hypothetical protein LBV42_02365 [Methanobrevibacter sp.]|jgi:hypothetical protein|nr:hypothetical protein [Methanobrevibacter sp.]
MLYKLKLEKIRKEKAKENIKLIRKEIESKDLDIKIENFIDAYSLKNSKEDIKKQIINNDIIAAHFAKDPSKQNLGEKLIEELDIGFKKLPSNGKYSVRFDDEGNIKRENRPEYTKTDQNIQKQQIMNKEGGIGPKNIQKRREEHRIINMQM